MPKRMIILLISWILTVSLTAYAQSPGKAWEKIITLPNGDVILDMNGEWDVVVGYRGPGGFPLESGTTKISQTGSSFVGVSMMALAAFRKGKEQIKGELDSNGFKQVQIFSSLLGTSNAKGQISEDGNEVIFDDGERLRMTFTRK